MVGLANLVVPAVLTRAAARRPAGLRRRELLATAALLDGSPCVHAGSMSLALRACTESKTRRRCYALEAKRPRRLGAFKTAPLMSGGETTSEKPDT